MKRSELIMFLGKFGLITSKGEYPKIKFPGWIKEIDNGGNVWFVDTDDQVFFFKAGSIKEFDPEDFKGK